MYKRTIIEKTVRAYKRQCTVKQCTITAGGTIFFHSSLLSTFSLSHLFTFGFYDSSSRFVVNVTGMNT